MATYNISVGESVHYFPDGPNSPVTLQLPGTADGVVDGTEVVFINREDTYTSINLQGSDSDLVEHPVLRGEQAPLAVATIGAPLIRFRMQYFGGVWYCMNTSPQVPKVVVGEIVTPLVIPVTYSEVVPLRITIPGDAIWNYALQLYVDWTPPGVGSWVQDIEIQLRLNDAVQRQFQSIRSGKPDAESFSIPLSFWLTPSVVNPGDIISVWARNAGEGTMEITADSLVEFVGPIL